MLDRTWKRVGHGREGWVGEGEQEEKWEKYQPTCTTCDSFLLNIAWLPMNVTYDNAHLYVILIVNLPPE